MKWLKGVALGLFGALSLALVWGAAIEPRLILDREEEVAAIPDLPPAWEGRRVALIADLQVGMWLANTDMIRRIVALLVEERPALVLIAGDFVYKPGPDSSDEIARVIELIRPLPEAGIPTWAVLGDHDYAVGPLEPSPKRAQNEASTVALRQALEAAGIRVLQNEAAPLPSPGDRPGTAARGGADTPLYLVGLEPHSLTEVDAATVVG